MSFVFWSEVNRADFQNQAAAENESVSSGFKKFEESGEYDVTIKNAEMRQTKAGDQKLTLRVQADSGESGFWDLLVGHGGGTSQAAKIARQSLALILKYSGAQASSPDDLINLRVKVWVKMEERDGYSPSPRFRPIGTVSGATTFPVKAAWMTAPNMEGPTPKQKPTPDFSKEDDDIPF
jgi:hypothetical protein|nr:MAG TPA: Protein of unknown function (DUF669) [Caudoviricetes sp.]